MNIKKTYKGILNGIHGIWCGFCPNNVVVEDEITVYYPDKNKVFQKGNEIYSCIILKDNESINDYTEIELESEVK